MSRLRLAAVALSLASMVGSDSGRLRPVELMFGLLSHAIPAAFIGAGLRGTCCADRDDLKPFFSGRKVVRIVFLPWSGLGLLDICCLGTGSVGGGPRGDGTCGTLFARSFTERLLTLA